MYRMYRRGKEENMNYMKGEEREELQEEKDVAEEGGEEEEEEEVESWDAWNRRGEVAASIGAFLDEWCELIPPVGTSNKDLRAAYTAFCGVIGFDAAQQNEFTEYLEKIEGVRWEKNPTGGWWEGINLIPIFDLDSDSEEDVKSAEEEWERFRLIRRVMNGVRRKEEGGKT
jgi:hypothetical protein